MSHDKKPLLGPDDTLSWRVVYEGEKEDTNLFVVCANCDEVRKDHLEDGKCAFEATHFVPKRLVATTNDKGELITDVSRKPK